MSNNTLFRILVFLVALPLLGAVAFLFPDYNLPVYAALVVGAAGIAAREAAFFFAAETRSYRGHAVMIPLVGATLPTVGYLVESMAPAFTAEALMVSVVLIAAVILTIQVGRRVDRRFGEIVPVVAMHLFLLVYPGIFAWYALRLAFLPIASWAVILFVFSVYLNDSAAWLFGRLFGKKTPAGEEPPVAVSPNKSRIGFLGGFLASPAVVVLFSYLLRDLVTVSTVRAILFGVVVGAAAILGDLVESALKRSASIKDSGQIIPGRGGLLDSIDSPLFAAPFFYYGFVLVFLS